MLQQIHGYWSISPVLSALLALVAKLLRLPALLLVLWPLSVWVLVLAAARVVFFAAFAEADVAFDFALVPFAPVVDVSSVAAFAFAARDDAVFLRVWLVVLRVLVVPAFVVAFFVVLARDLAVFAAAAATASAAVAAAAVAVAVAAATDVSVSARAFSRVDNFSSSSSSRVIRSINSAWLTKLSLDRILSPSW